MSYKKKMAKINPSKPTVNESKKVMLLNKHLVNHFAVVYLQIVGTELQKPLLQMILHTNTFCIEYNQLSPRGSSALLA